MRLSLSGCKTRAWSLVSMLMVTGFCAKAFDTTTEKRREKL
jgi:hypothetical protein